MSGISFEAKVDHQVGNSSKRVPRLLRPKRVRSKSSGPPHLSPEPSFHKRKVISDLGAVARIQLSLANSGLTSIKKSGVKNISRLLPDGPIDLKVFLNYTAVQKQYEILSKIEFTVAAKGEPHSIRHALKEVNAPKNCNKKLLPCKSFLASHLDNKEKTFPFKDDYNRVALNPLPNVPDSDYINASYIDSILKPNAYIATQGPIEETLADFWRMVWDQNSYIIVMLTKVFDFIRVMCSQYWPIELEKPKEYGPVEVTLLTEETLADFTIRTFRLRRDHNKTENKKSAEEENNENVTQDADDGRIVHQFHYHEWPIHSPPYANSILQFRRRVRIYIQEVSQERATGPIIVHCSDGCGRTGAYLCIDANLEFADEDNMYDVFGYTKRMRQARKGMIETVDQYKFIYECLEEAFISGKTWFPISELSQQMKYKSMKSSITRINEYKREYQKIVKMSSRFSIGDCAGGHRIENRDKNRNVSNVPPDNYRPYLTTFQSNDSTDYVNGVFVDGYTRSREYIVTEWPMPHTVADCWSLIYDHDCNSVVVLANPEESHTYPSFWPTEKEKKRKFGPVFTVELISYNHYTNVKSWIFRINKKVVSLTELMSGVKGFPKTTQFFQITCWPLGQKVPFSTNSLVELMTMVGRWRQRTVRGPICVVSTNGQSRAGVYCAANVAIEQVINHDEVDVFSAVKSVRKNRPQLVENMTEYKYCYDLISHYVLHYLKTPQM